ncbi:hypothetical protein [Streptomyces sp. NPDC090025]|uniref:hypothetical protein n=1 Tax=Streptomyces sp. NPDC090025 TaxID=3365922 RepID=UPI003835DB84
MTGSSTGGTRRRPGPLAVRAAAGVLAVLLGAAGCADPSGSGGGGDGGHTGRGSGTGSDSRWAAGITPEWMSRQLRLRVPDTARSAKAAYEVDSRFDTALLTFTLTRVEAETYLKENPPDGRWLEPVAATDVPPHDFAHFGVPEPETLKDGVRYGYVCPGSATPEPPSSLPDVYDAPQKRCALLYAHEYAPDRTRVYLRAHYEPGQGPALPGSP